MFRFIFISCSPVYSLSPPVPLSLSLSSVSCSRHSHLRPISSSVLILCLSIQPLQLLISSHSYLDLLSTPVTSSFCPVFSSCPRCCFFFFFMDFGFHVYALTPFDFCKFVFSIFFVKPLNLLATAVACISQPSTHLDILKFSRKEINTIPYIYYFFVSPWKA